MCEAARAGNVRAMEVLLSFGGDVHGKGKIAAKYDFIANDWDDKVAHKVAEPTEEEAGPFETPLFLAVQNGHLAAAQFLLAHGAATTPHMLTTAVQDGNCELLEVLVSGRDVSALMGVDEGEVTLLHWAALNGNVKMGEKLLSLGLYIDAKCGNGMTPFHFAKFGGHEEFVQFLVKFGCDVDERFDIDDAL